MAFTKLKNKQTIALVAVILIGVLLAVLILRTEKATPEADEHAHAESSIDARPQHGEPGHNHDKDHLPLASDANVPHDDHPHPMQAEEIAKGPHGGKLFTQDQYAVEVTIFEQHVPPEFRIYTYLNGNPLDPAASQVTIRLNRLGSEPQQFTFTKERDYLKGNAVVEEPHSFGVNIAATYAGKAYQFGYEQIEGRVNITDKQMTLNGIEVLTAGPANIKNTLHLQGEVKLNADKSTHVVPRVGGIVESVSINAGDKVRKGQLLATVSSQLVAELRSDLLAAQKRVELARTTYAREKQLWEEKVSAQQDYLQAQYALQEAEINATRIQQKLGALGAGAGGKGLARYEIRAPIDGVITNKQLSQGQVVSEVESVFEVADLSSVWVEVVIYAKDVNVVKVGQKVTVKSTAFDAQEVGTIAYVSALVGEKTRSAMARVVLNNASNVWLPGLPVNVALISDESNVPLAVSVESIQTLRDWNVVFARYGEFFEVRPVQLGIRDDKYVEVLKGLKAGDKYAAGNSFLIKADIGKAGASHDH